MKIVFSALSKINFYLREHISKFIMGQGYAPINPFMNFNYFFGGNIKKGLVRKANDKLISRSDELWVFGDISNGVEAEINLAKKINKTIRYFTSDEYGNSFKEIDNIKAKKEK